MPRLVRRIMEYEEARNAAWRRERPLGWLSIPRDEHDRVYAEFCREFDRRWYPKYEDGGK